MSGYAAGWPRAEAVPELVDEDKDHVGGAETAGQVVVGNLDVAAGEDDAFTDPADPNSASRPGRPFFVLQGHEQAVLSALVDIGADQPDGEIEVRRFDFGPVSNGVLGQPLHSLEGGRTPGRVLYDPDLDRFTQRPEVRIPGHEGGPRGGRDDRVVGAEAEELVGGGLVGERSQRPGGGPRGRPGGGSGAPSAKMRHAAFEERWAGPRPGSGHGRKWKSYSMRVDFHWTVSRSFLVGGCAKAGVMQGLGDTRFRGPAGRGAGPHRENWPEVGVPSRPGASTPGAICALAALRAACRPPLGELAGGRRSKPSPALLLGRRCVPSVG